MIGSFYFASTLLLFNMYIGLLTETFYKVYDNASAYASIEQATTILNMERVLSKEKLNRVADYIHENCEPCVSQFFYRLFLWAIANCANIGRSLH